MKNALLIIIAFAITVGAASAASAQSNEKIAKQILKLEAEYNEASKNPPMSDFERFYTSDFLLTIRLPPHVLTNDQCRKNLADPNFRRNTIESLIDDDVKVRVYDNSTALVTGHRKRVSKDADGKDTSASSRFTRIWVKQNSKWLLAGAHYSPDVDLEKLRSASR